VLSIMTESSSWFCNVTETQDANFVECFAQMLG
jgi:hypothetical protein